MPANRLRVVFLCGSLRFRTLFDAERRRLTTLDRRAVLAELYLLRIDLADEVRVVTEAGYFGPATRREIAYGREHGKLITSVDPTLIL